jgi:NPCBM/NEW2 domain
MSSQSPNSSITGQVIAGVVAGLILAAILGLIGWIWHKSIHEGSGRGSAAGSASAGRPATPTGRSAGSSSGTVTNSSSPGQTPASVAPAPAGPAAVYLADLTALPDEAPVTEPEQMGGVFYAHAVSTSSGGCARNQQNIFSYVISRKYTRFRAVIGLDDQSADGVHVQIEVIADGRSLFSQTFTAGQTANVKRSITGVRELKLEQIYLGPNPDLCSESATAVWGDAEVLP